MVGREVVRAILQGLVVLGLGTFVRVPAAMVHAPEPVGGARPAVASVEAVPEGEPLEAREPAPPKTDAVVIVALDGARWQEVLVEVDRRFATGDDRNVSAPALMPNLHRMIAEGAALGGASHGPPMVATGPHFISLPGYTEIFSGRSPLACRDNTCAATTEETLVDEIRATASDVAIFSSWAPIARAATKYPSEAFVSTGLPGSGEFRADRATADAAIAYFVERKPTFLFLGLGEPDEYAHRANYAGYLASLRQADVILGELRQAIADSGPRAATTSIFVTCDHGRADDFRDHGAPWPESSRVWLVAAGGAIPARGMFEASRRYRLADIAPTIRELLGLPPDTSSEAGSPIAELLPRE